METEGNSAASEPVNFLTQIIHFSFNSFTQRSAYKFDTLIESRYPTVIFTMAKEVAGSLSPLGFIWLKTLDL